METQKPSSATAIYRAEHVGGPGVRCKGCGGKMAEHIDLKDGRVLITCRRCKRLNIITERGHTLA